MNLPEQEEHTCHLLPPWWRCQSVFLSLSDASIHKGDVLADFCHHKHNISWI